MARTDEASSSAGQCRKVENKKRKKRNKQTFEGEKNPVLRGVQNALTRLEEEIALVFYRSEKIHKCISRSTNAGARGGRVNGGLPKSRRPKKRREKKKLDKREYEQKV